MERNKKSKIAGISKMNSQSHGEIPDMVIYYDRYELGAAECGKK